MKNIAWLLLLLIVVIASWQYIVNKNDRIAANEAYKQLEARYRDTAADYVQFRKWSDSALNNATSTAMQNGEIAKQSQSLLNEKQNRINSLLLLLDAAEKETPDSSWVQVSPNYKSGCDSLRRANAEQGQLIAQYEQDNQAHVDALNYETYIRDSALQKERAFSASFRQQLADCIVIGKKQQAINKPRNQVYAGMAAWGTTINPLGGGEINLGLKTKSDQFYEIKGAYLNGWWVGIGTKFLIKLK